MKECLRCKKQYIPRRPHHFFCTQRCSDHYNKSKSWKNYFRKLLQNGKNRKELTVEALLRMYEKQGGRCALSGVILTKITGKGHVPSNCSIDRIKPGAEYSVKNIRLVCHFVNSWRGAVTDKELYWWCKRIVDNG